MANNIGNRCIYADTVGPLWPTYIDIENIVYSGPFVAGHVAQLTDNAGRLVYSFSASNFLGSENSPKIGRVYGLNLSRIDSGNLTIYYS